eukprot:scaffold3504_cov240-Pinguiococcus_pyrenoidosus.AAC.48
MAAMENALDKLFILDYEQRLCRPRGIEPLHRAYFAVPGPNPSLQFKTLTDVCSWLVTEITGDPNAFVVEQFDDPNTSVNKLMLALRGLHFDLDFSATKLRPGHGEAVCAVLDFLTDKALQARNFSFQRPIYDDVQGADEAEADDDADAGDIEDEAEIEEEEEAVFTDAAPLAEGDAKESDAMHQMLEAKIDPVEWNTELERVGPRLRHVSKVRHRLCVDVGKAVPDVALLLLLRERTRCSAVTGGSMSP